MSRFHSFDAIGVLIWKHIKERMRRKHSTFWELFTGVLMFSVVVLLQQILREPIVNKNGTQQRIMSLNADDLNINKVVYWPNYNTTNSFMKKVAEEIWNASHYKVPIDSYLGFGSEYEVLKYLNTAKLSDPVIVVRFKDFQEGLIPERLYYSIGLSETNMNSTDSHFINYFDTAKDDIPPTTAYLQWAINKVFLEELSGEQIKEHVLVETVATLPYKARLIISFLFLCTVMAPLPFFLLKATRLVIEKRSGMKQLIALVGVTPNILRLSHLLDTILFALLYSSIVTILLTSVADPVVPNSNPILIGFTLILHLLNVSSIAFITSTLSQDYQHADSVALLVYLFTFVMDSLWYNKKVYDQYQQYIVCLILPHSAIYIFWDEVIYYEHTTTTGVQFKNVVDTHRGDCMPIALVWVYLLIQQIIMLTASWYLEMVRPGEYGVAVKWNFLCKKSFWKHATKRKRKKVNFHATVEIKTRILRDARYFESGPKGAEVAIKMTNVTKVFPVKEKQVVALDYINLDVYRGEITVLLGKNGAGKTTLLSIVTGMYSTTSGNVYVGGMDISARAHEIRKDLGLCPQKDLVFEQMTVRENVLFYASLKHSKTRDVNSSVNYLLHQLKIYEQANHFPFQLSTGMKRCLQVACALVGDSEVLVLDEPTAGMDSRSRHSLWDLLLVLRGRKTIFMSTTNMEEADALGDRIAILHHGKLKCFGTPAFLKDAIGFVFHLSVTVGLRNKEKLDEVKDEVLAIIPEATAKKFLANRITFKLPAKDRDHYPQLFDTLEEKKNILKITTMNVGMSMEKVFLKFIQETEEADICYESRHMTQEIRLTGLRLWQQQIQVLMARNFKFLWMKKYQFILLQVIVPILGLVVITITSNSALGYGKIYELLPRSDSKIILLCDMGPMRRTDVFNVLRSSYPELDLVNSNDIISAIRNKVYDHNHEKIHKMFGYKFESNRSIIFYPTPNEVSISKAIDVYSNLYMSLHMPYATNSSISMSYSPMALAQNPNETHKMPKNFILCIYWALWVSFLTVVPLTPLILISIEEFKNGVRYCHVIAGCLPVIHWLSKLLCHLSIFIVTIPVAVIIVVVSLDLDNTLNRGDFLGVLFLYLVLFAPAFLVHLYSFSFLLSKNHAISQIYIMSLCFALIAPIVLYFMKTTSSQSFTFVDFMNLMGFISPVMTLTKGLARITFLAYHNAFCENNKHLCPDKIYYGRNLNRLRDICCNSSISRPFHYVHFGRMKDFKDILLFVFEFIFYAIILMLLQHRKMQTWMGYIVNCGYRKPEQVYANPEVLSEKDYVRRKMRILRHTHNRAEKKIFLRGDIILVEDVHRTFIGNSCKRFNAVRGVSFCVKKGECLGILGPNGAGKTTLINSVCGRIAMTKGDCSIDGQFIRRHRTQYLHHMAVMKTRGGMDVFLTGYENLILISMLHGRPLDLAEKLATQYLQYMGLEIYGDALVRSYSAGCTRRLALCGVMLSAPVAAMLDEPSSSVDPHTYPLVVRAIQQLVDDGTACVITESNMDWRQMESVFTRMAILFNGQLAAIGPTKQLKSTLASGYAANIKLRTNAAFYVVTDESEDKLETMSVYSHKSAAPVLDVTRLKEEIKVMFDSIQLVDEHLSMLFYHIGETKKYSEIFTKLEALKHRHYVIEDYILGETPVEELYCKLQEHGKL